MNTSVRAITKLAFVALLTAVAGCEVSKSANPLSPSIAGPLPGVSIEAPRPVEPANGSEVLTTSPVRLVFDNAKSNSPRPFWHVIEIASDSSFGTKLYTSERLDPDASGRSSHVVPGRLAQDVPYYWRVRAEDGANVSSPSPPATFTVVEPVVIDPPVPTFPAGGVTTANETPDFVVTNGKVSGRAGEVIYRFQVATDPAFANPIASGSTTRGDGSTTTHSVGRLPAGQAFYWRAWGTNGNVTSEYSPVETFRTPEPIIIDPPIPVSPTGGATLTTRSPDFVVANGRASGPVTGVTYWFQVATDAAFASIVASVAAPRSGSQTTLVNLGTLAQNTLFYWRTWATGGPVTTALSAVQTFRTPAPPPPPPPPPPTPTPPTGGYRTPDPPAGQRLPLPNMWQVVQQVAREYPGALANSCQDHGGTWEFMDRVVDRLRQSDTRWGYNWKRGNRGDPSLDVVDYHWSSGPDENSTDVYIVDIIAGHCGSAPGPTWNDVTEVTRQNGTIGRWTGRGRF